MMRMSKRHLSKPTGTKRSRKLRNLVLKTRVNLRIASLVRLNRVKVASRKLVCLMQAVVPTKMQALNLSESRLLFPSLNLRRKKMK